MVNTARNHLPDKNRMILMGVVFMVLLAEYIFRENLLANTFYKVENKLLLIL